jgi:hypothetical protein
VNQGINQYRRTRADQECNRRKRMLKKWIDYANEICSPSAVLCTVTFFPLNLHEATRNLGYVGSNTMFCNRQIFDSRFVCPVRVIAISFDEKVLNGPSSISSAPLEVGIETINTCPIIYVFINEAGVKHNQIINPGTRFKLGGPTNYDEITKDCFWMTYSNDQSIIRSSFGEPIRLRSFPYAAGMQANVQAEWDVELELEVCRWKQTEPLIRSILVSLLLPPLWAIVADYAIAFALT